MDLDKVDITKLTAILAVSLMVLAFTGGLYLIFNAPSLGSNAAGAYLRSRGGSMYTGRYLIMVESHMTSFRVGGFVLSLVGGFGMLFSSFVAYQNFKNKKEKTND